MAERDKPAFDALSDDDISELARRLHWKEWHLQPTHRTADEEWAAMSDGQKEFYRVLVEFLVRELRGYVSPTTTR